ncbi:MAG: hypothetical protein RIT14_2679 [Pseudomonadota bacterium]|jgi:hypothetical protein
MATARPAPAQQGGSASPQQQQGQSQPAPAQQQGSTPVIRDWASI